MNKEGGNMLYEINEMIDEIWIFLKEGRKVSTQFCIIEESHPCYCRIETTELLDGEQLLIGIPGDGSIGIIDITNHCDYEEIRHFLNEYISENVIKSRKYRIRSWYKHCLEHKYRYYYLKDKASFNMTI